MFVKTFPVGAFQCNCTVLGDEETGEAIVIDPGEEGDKIVSELLRHSLKPKYLLHTHAHIDHIGATRSVKEKSGGKIALHKSDLFLYENLKMQGELLGVEVKGAALPIDYYLVHGDVVEWGKTNQVRVIHTPGHTPGSLSFLAKNLIDNQDVLFSGDTLFMGSIGRTDLWGGDFEQILHSIKTQILTLADSIQVIAGHGPQTTVGRERKANPFLGDL